MLQLVMSRGNFLKYNLYQKLYSKKYNFPIGLYIQQAKIEFSLSLPCDFGVEANLVIKVWEGCRNARYPSFFVIRNNVTTNIFRNRQIPLNKSIGILFNKM